MAKVASLIIILSLFKNAGHTQVKTTLKPRISPFVAMCKISAFYSTIKVVDVNPVPIPLKMRNQFAEVVSRIDWPDLGHTKPWETNAVLKELANNIDKFEDLISKNPATELNSSYRFRGSIALVLTAWSLHLHRQQFADQDLFLRCYDPSAHLLRGRTYQESLQYYNPTVSWDWPWTVHDHRLVLRPCILKGLGTNGISTTYDLLMGWYEAPELKPKK